MINAEKMVQLQKTFMLCCSYKTTFVYFNLLLITQVKLSTTRPVKYFIQENKAIVLLKPLLLFEAKIDEVIKYVD